MELGEAIVRTVDGWVPADCNHVPTPLGLEEGTDKVLMENADTMVRRFPPERFLELYILWAHTGGMCHVCDNLGPQATLEWLALERRDELDESIVAAAAKRLTQLGYGDAVEDSFKGLLDAFGLPRHPPSDDDLFPYERIWGPDYTHPDLARLMNAYML